MADFNFYPGQGEGGNTLSDLARYVMPNDKLIQNAGVGAFPFGFGQGVSVTQASAPSTVSMDGGDPLGGGFMGYPQPGPGQSYGDPAYYNATPLGQALSKHWGGAYDPNTNYGSPEYYQGPAGQAALASPGVQALAAGDSDLAGALAMAQNAGPYVPGSYGSAAQPGGSYNPNAGVDYSSAAQPGGSYAPSAFPGAASYGGQNFDLKSLFGGGTGFPGMTGLFGGGT